MREGGARRAVPGLALAACALCISCGGNRFRAGLFTEPALEVPTRMSLLSTVRGMREFRMEQGIEVICVGAVRRFQPQIDESVMEWWRSRREWERGLVPQLEGAAPRVVHADACTLDPGGDIRLVEDGSPALSIEVNVGWIQDDETWNSIEVVLHPTRMNRQSFLRFSYIRDEHGWWLDRNSCAEGLLCRNFQETMVVWGISNDGEEHSAIARRLRDPPPDTSSIAATPH